MNCLKCKKTFDNYRDLEKHEASDCSDEESELEKKYYCTKCGDCFERKSYLKEHMKIHTKSRPFVCLICGKGFGIKQYLKLHKLTHYGEKPFPCRSCWKRFIDRHSRDMHELKHKKNKPFKCTDCMKSFDTDYIRKLHMRSHSVLRQYSCPHCKQCFNEKYKLTYHLRLHKSGKISPRTTYDKGPDNERNDTHGLHTPKVYQCLKCGETFESKSQQMIHTRLPVGVVPYECVLCNKKMSTNCEVLIHNKMHAGQPLDIANPFNYKVNNESESVKLSNTETSIKLYTCRFCPEQYASEELLSIHLKTHRPDVTSKLSAVIKQDPEDSTPPQLHNSTANVNIVVHVCPQCGHGFVISNGITLDPDGNPLVCRPCAGQFSKLFGIDV